MTGGLTPLYGTIGVFTGAALSYAIGWKAKASWLRWLASGLFVTGFAIVTWLIVDRWLEAGRPPFKTLYESLLLFVWCSSIIYMGVERAARLPVIGAGAALMMAGTLAYAVFKQDVEIVNLPPALQSPWFVPHVVVYFVGYGALALATLAALVYIVKPHWRVNVRSLRGDAEMGYDALMYGGIVLGYALLTVGLLLGAVWAKQAWGDYWTWDPKENWALVTWLIYGMYLHGRRLPEFRGKRAAWLAVLGFAAVMFTYLGMHMLPTAEQSEHVYQ